LRPALQQLCADRINGIELPGPQKGLNQGAHRVDARLEREHAPRPAFVERTRPGTGGFGRLGPILPHKRGEHARLRQRRFAHSGIAEEDRQFVGRCFERPDYLDGLAPAAEEKVRIRLGHGGEAAVGRSVLPQYARQRTAAGGCINNLCNAFFRRRVRGDDPMQLPQEWQAGCWGTVEQHEDDREIVLLHAAVESLVIFDDLPASESIFPDQQHEGCRLGYSFSQLGQPKTAGA